MDTIRESRADRIFGLVNGAFLFCILIMILYPLLFILSSSFSSTSAVVSGKVWLFPVEFTFEGYTSVFNNDNIMTGFANSLFYVVAGTTLNVFLTILAGYPLSRDDFYGRQFFMLIFVITMLFDGGLIPRYILVKDLGLLNTRWSLILPTGLAVFLVFVTRTFFKSTIPKELLEASQMDGCNNFKYLWKVVIPVSAPIIAVLTLFYAIGHWNQFFNALIYLRDRNLFPLQLILNQILVRNEIDATMLEDIELLQKLEGMRELLKYSLIVVASAPALILYPFVQKHFVKGVMLGSLKG